MNYPDRIALPMHDDFIQYYAVSFDSILRDGQISSIDPNKSINSSIPNQFINWSPQTPDEAALPNAIQDMTTDILSAIESGQANGDPNLQALIDLKNDPIWDMSDRESWERNLAEAVSERMSQYPGLQTYTVHKEGTDIKRATNLNAHDPNDPDNGSRYEVDCETMSAIEGCVIQRVENSVLSQHSDSALKSPAQYYFANGTMDGPEGFHAFIVSSATGNIIEGTALANDSPYQRQTDPGYTFDDFIKGVPSATVSAQSGQPVVYVAGVAGNHNPQLYDSAYNSANNSSVAQDIRNTMAQERAQALAIKEISYEADRTKSWAAQGFVYDDLDHPVSFLQKRFDQISDPDEAKKLIDEIVHFNKITDGALGNPFANSDNPDIRNIGAQATELYARHAEHKVNTLNAESFKALEQEFERSKDWDFYHDKQQATTWLQQQFDKITDPGTARQLIDEIAHFNKISDGQLGNPFANSDNPELRDIGDQAVNVYLQDNTLRAQQQITALNNESLKALDEEFDRTKDWDIYHDKQQASTWLQQQFDNITDPGVARQLIDEIAHFNKLTDGQLGNPFANSDNPELQNIGLQALQDLSANMATELEELAASLAPNSYFNDPETAAQHIKQLASLINNRTDAQATLPALERLDKATDGLLGNVYAGTEYADLIQEPEEPQNTEITATHTAPVLNGPG